MSREKILTELQSLTSTPIAFQAQWDGDSTGWFVVFSAITNDGQSRSLGILSGAGDIRLFNGQVPPWPEAVVAKQLGNELAEQFGAEFYFPSPNHPEDECPDWKDRDKSYPCRRCGIPLLQGPDCSWLGFCFHCHLDDEREQREAKWTPEQRAGLRCYICGNPASTKLNGGPVCADCFDKYEIYKCEKCNVIVMLPKSTGHTTLCRRCELQNTVNSLTPAQRNLIRDAMANGRFEGLDAAIKVMGCSLNEAQSVLELLRNSDPIGKTA